MPPIREYGSWNMRGSDELSEVEPLRKYVFICEGSKTEVHYFRELIAHRGELGIHPLVDLRLWEKTDEDAGLSNPQALLQFAQREKESNRRLFDPIHDRMVIVFDLDIYSRVGKGRKGANEKKAKFEELRRSVAANDILAVTNPSFELFLLLHSDGAYDRLVSPNETEILRNTKSGNQRFVQRLFSETYGMNPKSNPAVGRLAAKIDTAIKEEKNLNQELDHALTHVTSNIGKVIEVIRNDHPKP